MSDKKTPLPSRVPGPLNEELWFAVADTRSRMRDAMNADTALAPIGLTLRSYAVLSIACTGDDFSQREIGGFLNFDGRQVVNLVDDLEKRGYTERVPNPRDRRANCIRATETGVRMHAAARAMLREREEVSLSELNDLERDTLLRLLARIHR